MRTKLTIAMSTMYTIQADRTVARPAGGPRTNAPVQPIAVRSGSLSGRLHEPVRWGGWQWLFALVGLLGGWLVPQAGQAQTFCAPDATAYYSFENTFNDQSAYNDISFPATTEDITSTFSLPTFSTTAKVGVRSASFNGAQYLRYDNASGYMHNGGNSTSIMFWFKANAPTSGIQTLFEQGDLTNGLAVRLNAGTLQARLRTLSGTTVDLAGPAITDNNWHHVALIYQINTTSTVRLYLDGSQVSSGTLTLQLGTVVTPGGIGASLIGDVWAASTVNGNYFNGLIDDFVYSLGPDVNNVPGIGPSAFTQTDITNYLNCVNGFATNSFTCDGSVFIAQQPTGTTNTALKKFVYANNSFTTIDGTGSMLYNAAGYNRVDNKIYAISMNNGSLIRVGANGVIEDLGYVTGLPVLGYNTADISPAGIMYIANSSDGIAYAVNLNTIPYTATAVTMSSAVYVGDWSLNPGDNLLYSVDQSGRIEKINPTTGAVSIVSPTNGFLPAGVYGAIWFDQFNNMYAYENFTGAIQRYNTVTNSWSTVVSSGAAISQNDAAACPQTYAEPQIAKVIQSQSGNRVTFDITLSNNGPSPAADLIARDVLPTGLVFQSAQVLDANSASLASTAYTLSTPAVGANGTVQLTVKNLNVGTDNRVILRLTAQATTGTCSLTVTNRAEITSAFGQTTNNGATDCNTADNTTNIPGDVASNNEACVPVSFSLTPAAPTATPSSTSLCSGGVFTLNYTNVPSGQTVSWVRMPDSLTGTGSLSQALSATGTSPISYTYTAVHSNIYGCPSQPTVTVVTVNPVPILTPSVCSQTICSGQTGAITFNSSVPATINWLRVEDNTTGTGNISQLFNTAGTYTYKIWGVSSSASCPSSTTITCTIVVNNCCTLVASASASNTVVCVGQTISLASTVTGNAGAVTYAWSGPNGFTSNLANPTIPSATSAMSGIYTLTVSDPTASTACIKTATVTITVGSLVASASSNSPLCTAGTLALSGSGSGGNGSYSYAWSGPNGFTSTLPNPTLALSTSAQSGTYTLTVTDTQGCSGTATTAVTVATQPSLSISGSPSLTICSGQSTTLSVTGDGGAPITWTNSLGQSGTGATINFAGLINVSGSPQTVTYVILANAGTCSDSKTVTVTINPVPTIKVTPLQAVVCATEQTTVTATASSPTATINWSRSPATPTPASGTGTGSVTITETLPAGAYTYSFTATQGGCTSSPATSQVTVNN
ncbi:DUF6923 family protein [Spirosoma radiotolerans]|uniref:DUF11 domain-containing protein n=1 Tax=Spirosoma radiotolerans TaxID=1379870 RepID=A0A0E3ZTE4_9BACT|nr:LamG domain-containing protein [Spirosoma radiotolerans]AKD53808.1 hypothetical protein SD10_01715 [Spirosoma radiotolerans]